MLYPDVKNPEAIHTRLDREVISKIRTIRNLTGSRINAVINTLLIEAMKGEPMAAKKKTSTKKMTKKTSKKKC